MLRFFFALFAGSFDEEGAAGEEADGAAMVAVAVETDVVTVAVAEVAEIFAGAAARAGAIGEAADGRPPTRCPLIV